MAKGSIPLTGYSFFWGIVGNGHGRVKLKTHTYTHMWGFVIVLFLFYWIAGRFFGMSAVRASFELEARGLQNCGFHVVGGMDGAVCRMDRLLSVVGMQFSYRAFVSHKSKHSVTLGELLVFTTLRGGRVSPSHGRGPARHFEFARERSCGGCWPLHVRSAVQHRCDRQHGCVFCHVGETDSDSTVAIGAGCSILQAQEALLARGRQLKGFGSITTQRIGGGLSTSLHGQHVVSFSDHLRGITAMLANGTVVVAEASSSTLDAWRGSMGMLGVLLEVRLQTFATEFVTCDRTLGNASVLAQMLTGAVDGFEARGILPKARGEVRARRRCGILDTHVRAANTTGVVTVEDVDHAFMGFLMDNVILDWALFLGAIVPRIPGIDRLLVASSAPDTTVPGKVVATANDYRTPVSFHPHFDEEYTVPISMCVMVSWTSPSAWKIS